MLRAAQVGTNAAWLCRCRRWVLQQVLQRLSAACRGQQQQQGETGSAERGPPLDDQLTRTLHQEMKVCCDAACRYPSNYNAWSHRIWVLQRMARGNVKVRSGGGSRACAVRQERETFPVLSALPR